VSSYSSRLPGLPLEPIASWGDQKDPYEDCKKRRSSTGSWPHRRHVCPTYHEFLSMTVRTPEKPIMQNMCICTGINYLKRAHSSMEKCILLHGVRTAVQYSTDCPSRPETRAEQSR
jgi:hypothetical protein